MEVVGWIFITILSVTFGLMGVLSVIFAKEIKEEFEKYCGDEDDD